MEKDESMYYEKIKNQSFTKSREFEKSIKNYTNISGILTIGKLNEEILVVPCGENKHEENLFAEALEMISNPLFGILKNEKIYNWTRCTKSFAPLLIPDDAYSLYHALSISIFGVSDKMLLFQSCLLETIKSNKSTDSHFFKQWGTFMKDEMKRLENPFNDQEIENKWFQICDEILLTDLNNNNHSTSKETCSNFDQLRHKLFVLSHICRRVLVVVGFNNDDFQSSVYVPFMLPADECVKSPIYLAYHCSKFAPLVLVNEIPTENKVCDNCIPLTDSNFKLLQFPFVNDSSDGIKVLESYCSLTKIAYTTFDRIMEIPAIRVPVKREITKSDSSILSSCFAVLNITKNPLDVSRLWNYALNLDINNQNSLSGALYQPENSFTSESNSFQEEANDVTEVKNSQLLSHEHFTEHRYGRDSHANQSALVSSHMSLQCSDVYCNEEESDSSNYFLSNHRHSALTSFSDVSSHHCDTHPKSNVTRKVFPYDTQAFFSNQEVFDETVQESALRDQVQEIVEASYNHTSNDIDSVENESSINSMSSNSVEESIMRCISESHVILNVPQRFQQLHVPVFKLMLNNLTVTVKLSYVSKSIQLSVAKPSNVQVLYTLIQSVELEMKLERGSDNRYTLNIKHSMPLLTEEQGGIHDVSSLWADDTETESAYVDVATHHMKCRTAGCIGVAERRKPNLCSSCRQSWVKIARRPSMICATSSAPASSSYMESSDFTSNESNLEINRDQNKNQNQLTGSEKSCRSKNCQNSGEKQFYGLCSTCFRKTPD